MTPRTIALTGATGFLGRAIARELLSRGHTVRALVRDRGKTRGALPSDAGDRLKVVEGDLFHADALRELLHGSDACIHAVGLLRESGNGQTFQRVHADVTRVLLAACRTYSVTRLVHISALGVHDEVRTAYQKTKWEAEQTVRRSGLDWTILRPSLIHGVDGEFIRVAAGWARGSHSPWIFMPYFTRGELSTHEVPLAAINRITPRVQPVAVEDVARAAAESLDRSEAVGETYNLAGPDVFTWPDLLRTLRDALPGGNEDIEPRPVPSEPAAAFAFVAGKLGFGSLLPFDAGMAVMGATDSTASTAKARAHLGFEPRPFREAFASYAGRVG
ncbi:MAG: NAD(P)H-binding protein [Phycisphaerales bacterium]